MAAASLPPNRLLISTASPRVSKFQRFLRSVWPPRKEKKRKENKRKEKKERNDYFLMGFFNDNAVIELGFFFSFSFSLTKWRILLLF